MDLVIYVIFIITSFGLGILVVKDRVFGIAGIAIGFVGASALYSDGTLVISRICDPTSTPCTWTSFSISGSVAIWIEVAIIALNFILLYNENEKFKPTAEYEYSDINP